MNIHPAAKYGFAVWCLVSASALPAIAQERASCPKPGTVPDPIFRTHTLPPYPVISLRRHEQGIVILSVRTGTDGVPSDVTVVKSSAGQSLNDAAMEHIKTHWRWAPPMPDCPSAAQIIVTVMWNQMRLASLPDADFHVKMPASAYPPSAVENLEYFRSTLLAIDTDAQGAVTGGRVIESSGFADLDDQALAIVKNSPALMKSQAAGTHTVSADWESSGPMPNSNETVIVTGPARP